MGIARLDMENAFPNVRGGERGVREDHQVKVFARRASTGMDRFAGAGHHFGHKAAMGLKDIHKTGAKYPFLGYEQNVVNWCTSIIEPVPAKKFGIGFS